MSWVMPAEEAPGRGMEAQSVFSGIESPIAPVSGLVASELYRCVPVAETVGLKSAANWSSTFWMVSEPTPTASFSAGEFAATTFTFFVAAVMPGAVTVRVYVVVFGEVQTPSVRTEQPFVPPLPNVTVLGRAGGIVQVHFAVVGVAASWKPARIPPTTF